MVHTPHELADEFPEHAHLIHELKMNDPHVARLIEEYNQANEEVYRLESRLEASSEEREQDLRKRRLRLKDEIAARLAEAARADG